MKKVSIVFHSVCGNDYLIATEFYKALKGKNVVVNLFRVKDTNLEKIAAEFPVAKEYYNQIKSVPYYDFQELLDSDALILGSPTYFGNVSSAMKGFMDEFVDYWVNADFYGKKLFAFACAGTEVGGADLCLRAINTFAQHLGMITIPVPSNLVEGESYPAYGLVHFSGENSDIRPGEKIKKAIDKICDIIIA